MSEDIISKIVGDDDWAFILNFYLSFSSRLKVFLEEVQSKTEAELVSFFNSKLDAWGEEFNTLDPSTKGAAIEYYSFFVPAYGLINGAANTGILANRVLKLVKVEAESKGKSEGEILLELAKLGESDMFVASGQSRDSNVDISDSVVSAYESLISIQNRMHVFSDTIKGPFKKKLRFSKNEVLLWLKN